MHFYTFYYYIYNPYSNYSLLMRLILSKIKRQNNTNKGIKMSNLLTIIALYLLAFNLIEFILMGIDKSKARRGSFRIPESTLFLFSIVGGSIGGLIGMKFFRHKTQKPAFYIGFPIILTVQILLVIYILFLSPFSFKVM